MASRVPSDKSPANSVFGSNWSKDNFKQIEHLTPTENILDRIRQCPSDKTPVILITTGSYCPIHKMHIEMHDIAREHIQNNFSVRVVGSLLSASHDSYLKSKLESKGDGKFWLDVRTRINLIDLAIRDHDLVEQDLFEPSAPMFISFSEIIRLRKLFFQWLCTEHRVREPIVVMLVGEDMLKCGLYPRFPKEGLGLAIVGRKNSRSTGKSHWPKISVEKQMEEKVFWIEHVSDIDVSSTLVRRASAKKDYAALFSLLHPDVATEVWGIWNPLGTRT